MRAKRRTRTLWQTHLFLFREKKKRRTNSSMFFSSEKQMCSRAREIFFRQTHQMSRLMGPGMSIVDVSEGLCYLWNVDDSLTIWLLSGWDWVPRNLSLAYRRKLLKKFFVCLFVSKAHNLLIQWVKHYPTSQISFSLGNKNK